MGHLSNLWRLGRMRRGKPATNRNPLQAIVGRELNEYGGLVEVLACGHQQYPRHDIIGETNAVRRRCRRCGRQRDPV